MLGNEGMIRRASPLYRDGTAIKTRVTTDIITLSMPLSLTTGTTWVIPANHHVQYALGPGEYVSGSDTIQGDGSFILFEL